MTFTLGSVFCKCIDTNYVVMDVRFNYILGPRNDEVDFSQYQDLIHFDSPVVVCKGIIHTSNHHPQIPRGCTMCAFARLCQFLQGGMTWMVSRGKEFS